MTLANDPHRTSARRARLIGLAFVAILAVSLLVFGGTAAIPSGAANATTARASDGPPTASIDIGQQFYLEKAWAPVQELPAQF